MIKSPIELYNAAIVANLAVIDCSSLPYLKVDPFSLKNISQNCKPQYLVLDEYDDYTSIVIKNKSLVLNGDNVTEIEIPISEERHPIINITSNAENVTFSNANESNSLMVFPIISDFRMKKKDSTIISYLNSNYFDIPILVSNFDGTLKIMSAESIGCFKLKVNFYEISSNVKNS